jgi:hypothetical protein
MMIPLPKDSRRRLNECRSEWLHASKAMRAALGELAATFEAADEAFTAFADALFVADDVEWRPFALFGARMVSIDDAYERARVTVAAYLKARDVYAENVNGAAIAWASVNDDIHVDRWLEAAGEAGK